ncbi:MAG: amidohydrolase [Myxococcales bacterium]|nr:amidohydrolase [Myxococcales bacterium]
MRFARWILNQADVVSLDPQVSDANAVAIGDGKVLAVGSSEDLRVWIGPETEVLDLGGATILPGFHDAHGHVLGYALSFAQVNLVGSGSEQDAVERVVRFAATLPATVPIVGRGWDQNLWPERSFPTHHLLSSCFPHRPVALKRVDGHAVWVNDWVLSRVGISRGTPDPVGGQLVRGVDGKPSGVLIDTAMSIVEHLFPQMDDAEVLPWVAAGLKRLADYGLTAVSDMGIDPLSYRILRLLDERGELPLRVVGYLDAQRFLDMPVSMYPPVTKHQSGDVRFTIAGVKFYQDGALGSRGAALCTCYDDDPDTKGLLFYDLDTFTQKLANVMDAGYQPAVHAIGDHAVHVVLNSLERVLMKPGRAGLRPRIEHAQIVLPQDLRRFAALGVVASIQPRHAVSDRAWAGARIGKKRLENAYLARSFVDAGVSIALGTDFPIEPPDPWLAWLAATERTDLDGQAPVRGGSERLTKMDALIGATAGAAFAAGLPGLGSISPGKWADLTILNLNPLKQHGLAADPWKILGTMVGGIFVKNPCGTSTSSA